VKDCILLEGLFNVASVGMNDLYFVSNSVGNPSPDIPFLPTYLSDARGTLRILQRAAIILEKTGNEFVNITRAVLVGVLTEEEEPDSDQQLSVSESTGGTSQQPQEKTIYCTFEMPVLVLRVNPANQPDINSLIAEPGRKTHHLQGELRPNVRLCID
jgi:hypothetical protein